MPYDISAPESVNWRNPKRVGSRARLAKSRMRERLPMLSGESWPEIASATVVMLFGFQVRTIVEQPLVIAMIAVPLVLQSYGIFAVGWLGARLLKLPHDIAGPACLIGTSNFFELAVAVAISLFGLKSGAALDTVVGVLVEVPVMLSLVWFVNRQRGRSPDLERGA